MNRVVLVGRLARDPMELKRSVNNVAAINFTVAVDNRSKKEDNNADYIACVAFNKTAEFVDSYFKKGMLVGIDGRLQSRSYEKDGRTVYVTEVVCENVQILEKKGTTHESSDSSNRPTVEMKPSPAYDIIDDDDLNL